MSTLVCQSSHAEQTAPANAFRVLAPTVEGPQITPYLQDETDMTSRQDEERIAAWRKIQTKSDLFRLRRERRHSFDSIIMLLGWCRSLGCLEIYRSTRADCG